VKWKIVGAIGALAAGWAAVGATLFGALPAPAPGPAAVAGPPSCAFEAGAHPAATVGLTEDERRAIPITHVVVVMQENRSFDHYFGKLSEQGQPDADGIPPDYSNPDLAGRAVRPHHLPSTCVPDDPPHQWDAMHAQWDDGRMDGFVRVSARAHGDGHDAVGFYDGRDLPFYYWLARTFAISDRHFSPVLGGTWHNRHFLYAATSKRNGKTGQLTSAPTIFDALDRARVAWKVYTESGVRQDCIGWARPHPKVASFEAFVADLTAGRLPPVTFVDPTDTDEHPPNDIQNGEAWFRKIYVAATASPLWPRLAIFLTYDEAGGFFDHVAPPPACPPSPELAEFDRLGTRVPFVLVSPWARPHHVSHRITDHTALLKLIELLHDLPALSARDANADALLDLFDFDAPSLLRPAAPPASGTGGCPARRPAITRR
jgi:phospholipase C